VGHDLLLDAVSLDAYGARMNVAINLPPHIRAILVVTRAPPLPRACYTRFMRYDGMVTTPALRVFPETRDYAGTFAIMVTKH
jgi:hypothetical protein